MESNYDFTITHNDQTYIYRGTPSTTLDMVWAREKCWFLKGSVVTITDSTGKSKTYVKEK
jgi:hypothetical protein